MENLSTFCSCTNLACPLHPTKHDKGCTPCIQKNLRLKEMPNCFFNLVEGTENMAAIPLRISRNTFCGSETCFKDAAQGMFFCRYIFLKDVFWKSVHGLA